MKEFKHPCAGSCSGYKQARDETLDVVIEMIERTKEGDPEDWICVNAREILRHELLSMIKELRND